MSAVLETTASQPSSFGTFSGELYFAMLIILLAIAGYFLITYIIQRWFGHGMIVAKDAWQKGLAIIQHFETGKNAILKLARVEGDAFRHQQIRDGTIAAMPNGVNLLGSKQWVNTFALFGASIPPELLAGIAALKSMGLNSIEDVKAKTKKTDTILDMQLPEVIADDGIFNSDIQGIEVFDGDTVVLEGYNFNSFDDMLKQSSSNTLIPLSIEDVPKFINKSINPHDTEFVIGLEVENEMSETKDEGSKYLFLTGMALFIISLGFIVIWNAVANSGGAT